MTISTAIDFVLLFSLLSVMTSSQSTKAVRVSVCAELGVGMEKVSCFVPPAASAPMLYL